METTRLLVWVTGCRPIVKAVGWNSYNFAQKLLIVTGFVIDSYETWTGFKWLKIWLG